MKSEFEKRADAVDTTMLFFKLFVLLTLFFGSSIALLEPEQCNDCNHDQHVSVLVSKNVLSDLQVYLMRIDVISGGDYVDYNYK